MTNLFVDVKPILESIGASVSVTGELDLGVLEVGEEQFTLKEPAQFSVVLSNAGEALVTTGSITADVTANCSRCLCDFPLTIHGDVEGFYTRPGDTAPEEEEAEEVDSEGRIDLAPALLAALVVEAPFAPLHDEDCAGLCPGCGVDLNTEDCTCAEEPSDEHPFAALKGLLPPDNESSD